MTDDDGGGDMVDDVCFFDIESHNVGRHWDMTPREFFRLGQGCGKVGA